MLIAIKYIDNPIWLKPFLHGVLLIGLLIISVSKEKIENEFIVSLRSQSYRLAFILAIVYSLVQPLANFAIATLSFIFYVNSTIVILLEIKKV